MQNRRLRKEQREILELLGELPESSDEAGMFWLHEPAIVATLYGHFTRGARRHVRNLLIDLEKSGKVERRNWERGTSWRIKNKA